MTDPTLTVREVDGRPLPNHVAEIITTPHRFEGPNNRPVWLIMINRRDGDGWSIHSIASDENQAAYLYMSAGGGQRGRKVFVERVPTNHVFGGEMLEMAWRENREIMRQWRRERMAGGLR